MYACPREMSHCRILQAGSWGSMLTDSLCVTVCAWLDCVCVCVSAVLVCMHICESCCTACALLSFDAPPCALHAALLMERPSRLLCYCYCKRLKGRMGVCVRVLSIRHSHYKYLSRRVNVLPSHSLSSALPCSGRVLGLGGRGRRWNWAEICQTWWCLPTPLPLRSV